MISPYHLEVAEHYERFPYPQYPWYALGSWSALQSVDIANWGLKRVARDLWVVGCGTVAPQMFGRRNPRLRILATDLSQASLDIALKRLRLFGTHNVCLRCEDLMEARYVDAFDAIDCFGVLHHTFSPQKGLEKLERALRPGGVLRLMLYSRKAREKIENLRAEIVRAGIKNISDVVTHVRTQLDHSERTGDLSNSFGIADAILNPIIHVFDEDALENLLKQFPSLQVLRRSTEGNFVVHLLKDPG